MTRKITIPPIPPETFENIVAPWLQGIARKDIVAVMSYPASDRQRRVLQLLADKKIQRKYLGPPERFSWISIDFRVDPIDDVIDLEQYIVRKITDQTNIKFPKHGSLEGWIDLFKKKSKQKIVLICFGCEELLRKQKTPILIWIASQCRVDGMRFLLFFEANLFSSQALDVFGRVRSFQPRIYTMSLYSESDVQQFMRYLEHKWSLHVDSYVRKEMVQVCGGSLLLIKEAVWYLRDHAKAETRDIFSHPEMQFNLAILWNGFNIQEHEVFEGIFTHTELHPDQQSSIHYLLNVGFIRKQGKEYVCTVPLLEKFRKIVLFSQHRLVLKDKGELYLENINVTMHFSRSQKRILGVLLRKSPHVATRQEVASAIWPSNTLEQYSDWAIDSHMSRLRIKLVQLGIPEDTIVTAKRKGFAFGNKETTL